MFLEEAAKLFEIVVFTASREWYGQIRYILIKQSFFRFSLNTVIICSYAKEIIKIIDKKGVVSSVLSRTDCVLVEDNYIKDLECLGRELVNWYSRLIIRRNIPLSLIIPTMHLGIR